MSKIDQIPFIATDEGLYDTRTGDIKNPTRAYVINLIIDKINEIVDDINNENIIDCYPSGIPILKDIPPMPPVKEPFSGKKRHRE